MKKKDAQKIVDNAVKNIIKRKGLFDTSNNEPAEVLALHKRETQDEKVIEFQKKADDLLIVSAALGKSPKELNLYKSFRNFLEDSELAKAMGTTTAGSGLEWIPTDFSADLINKFELAKKVAGLFTEINMPTDPFKLTQKTAFSSAKLGSENTAPTASQPTTANVSLDAKKLIVFSEMSYEIDEDSIIAMLPVIREDIVASLARGYDNALLNGDDSGTHMDSNVTAADDVRKAWKGLRKFCVANSYTRDLSTFNFDNIVLMKQDMGVYGVDPMSLTWIASTTSYSKLLTLRDSQNNNVLITMDKVGPRATVLTGQVGSLLGSPVIVSEEQQVNLNDSGVYDGTTTDKTVLMLVRRDGFTTGSKRSIMVEQDKNISAQTIQLVSSMRKAFIDRYPIATNRTVNMGIKIS